MSKVTNDVESMVVELMTELEPFKTFVNNTIFNHNPEPFCPFSFSGYCNDAYSNRCYQCECAVKDYLRVDEIK